MMIDFNPITIDFKDIYFHFVPNDIERGCETSFANLNIWGFHQYAIIHEQLVLFSLYNGHNFYSFPIGRGDKKSVIDAIIEDSKERHIPCLLFCLYGDTKEILEKLYPQKFDIRCDRDSFDYVYDIHDLADLQGRKYHKKRTHYNHFCKAFPEYTVEPINKDNVDMIKSMLDKWYHDRLTDNPDNDYASEQKAIEKAFLHYEELDMEGLILLDSNISSCSHNPADNNHILAVTLGSRLSDDTFDVHFEKARWDVDGAYTVINKEFAKYIKNKYPHIKFLNREEDMGLAGLRKAKESYYPHHMVEKARAFLKEV